MNLIQQSLMEYALDNPEDLNKNSLYFKQLMQQAAKKGDFESIQVKVKDQEDGNWWWVTLNADGEVNDDDW